MSSKRNGNDEESTPLLKSIQRGSFTNSDDAENATSTEHVERAEDWDTDLTNNPRNWNLTYKWVTVALVSFIEFLTTMPNFMYAPNISDAQKDLNTDDDTLATLSLTIYILGFGLGPLLFAPLSEMYGRAQIYRVCLFVFLGCTVGCALANSIGMLIVFRFLAGSLGAAPVAIGGAVVGDLFASSERGTAMSVYQAGLIISAVVGPPMGALIGSFLHWRWVFWIVCIMTGVAFFFTVVVLRETHAPTLKRQVYGSKTDDGENQTLITRLSRTLRRPLKMVTQSPVVFCSCGLIFIVIGMLNIFLTEMSKIFQREYGMTSGQSGNVYFGLATGFVIASVVFGMTNDRMMHALADHHKGEMLPEFRLPATIAAMPVIVVGMLMYGWSLEYELPFMVPIVGSGIAGIGITTVQLSITTYLTDSFETFSASALAAITMARSIGGAVVPLLAPVLYRELGQGWGNTVFAGVNLGCCILPVLLYYYGAWWRGFVRMDDL